MILYGKLKKNEVGIACRLFDMALMVNNIDINIIAVFCLHSLAENFETHKFLVQLEQQAKQDGPIGRP
jgi:hypothetical protein